MPAATSTGRGRGIGNAVKWTAVRSIIVSTIVYFAASFFIKRKLVDMGIPKGMTRGITVFALALLAAYGVAAALDWLFPPT